MLMAWHLLTPSVVAPDQKIIITDTSSSAADLPAMATVSTVVLLAFALSASAVSGQSVKDGRTLNLAHPYSSDFHVSFAVTAFTTIVFALTVFGVSLGMWFMDPGRDSIIYRMTSQRMKKDQ